MPDDNVNILITGGAGFIGSNFVCYFLDKHSNYNIVNIDKLTYAADLANLKEVEDSSRYTFIEGDICNYALLEEIFNKYDIRGVIHFAAESHVDNAIKKPLDFVSTNVNGTINLLENARALWLKDCFIYKKDYENCRFHHISTDEVYGSLGEEGFFTEESPYAPNNPYSASKASSDMLVRSYNKTYGLNTVITNCSNNFGPKQHDEKLIPTIIRSALSLKPIPIYGRGKNVRDWLYVIDHCRAIDLVYHKGVSGETYNISCNNEYQNIDLAHHICKILDSEAKDILNKSDLKSFSELITFVKDRPGHDLRYAIDSSKLQNDLGWDSCDNLEESLIETVRYYVSKYNS